VGTLPAVLGEHPAVQGVSGQLHQGVGEAPLPAAVIALPGGTGERLRGGAQGGTCLAVQVTPEKEGTPLGRLQLQEARLHLIDLLGEEAAGVGGVAEVGTVVAELSDGVAPGPGEERPLVERGREGSTRRGGTRVGRTRCGGIRPAGGEEVNGDHRQASHPVGGPRHQRQMGIADLALDEGPGALRHPGRLRTDHQGVPRRGPGEVALLLDPVGRRVVPQPLHLSASGQLGDHPGELQLHPVDKPAPPHHLVADRRSRPLTAGAGDEALEGGTDGGELLANAPTTPHISDGHRE
jgi:hypothetical protein